MSRKMIAIAHSYRKVICCVILVWRFCCLDVIKDVTESFRVLLGVHASKYCRYSGKESTDLNQYLDGKRWKCQKLRRDLLILRSVIPQSGVECVCSYVRSFTFDCRGSKNRSTRVDLQKYFTAHSINQDGNVSAWSLRSPPVPTQETPLDFSWAHMSIDPEANVRLKETRECGRTLKVNSFEL